MSQRMGSFTAFQKKIGENIKLQRELKKMTQEELANRALVSVNVISRLERGIANPRVSTLYKMALILDVPVSEIFKSVV